MIAAEPRDAAASLQALVGGVGLWGRGRTSFAALVDGRAVDLAASAAVPRPALVPARELRRLPTPARLAVEVASQACAAGEGVALDEVLPVFTSAIGDADITDYMCRTLAGAEKLLSPIRFQNSVHNAPAGYLSIATDNRRPTTFVAAFEHSFALALLDALVLLATECRPVLLITTDVCVPRPLADVHGVGEQAASALLLLPTAAERQPLARLSAMVAPASRVTGETVAGAPGESAARCAPAAATRASATLQAWPLLQALAGADAWRHDFTLGPGCLLDCRLSATLEQAA